MPIKCLLTLLVYYHNVGVFDLPDECVTLVFEHPYLLDIPERSERLLHQFVGESTGQSTTVHGAVGRARLVVHFVERQRFGVG